jgi:hypothetical protein
MKNFFGLLPGQSISGFAAELKALSLEEKLEFHRMLNAAGYECDPPSAPAVTPA